MLDHSNKPLILHTRVVSGQGGGPEKTILNSPRFLELRGFSSSCLYFRDPEDVGFDTIRQRALQKRAPLLEVDDFGLSDWRILRRLKPLVLDLKPAIWHGHDYKSNLLGLVARRWLPSMRLVTTVHGWVQRTWKTPLYYAIDRQCLKRYDHVICVSRDLIRDCRRLGVPEQRLSLVDNAIALDDYPNDLSQSEARSKLNLDLDRPLVIGVGRLSAEKAFDRLIDAVVQLAADDLPVALAIAGDGDQREALQARIDRSGLADRIRLLGFIADPRLIYAAADLFVLSSLREGLPNVVLEAMAMNVPVVATEIAGMPDLVVDGLNGVVIPPGSTESIRSAIDDLLAAPGQAEALAIEARQRLVERFGFDRRMDRISAIYREVIDRR